MTNSVSNKFRITTNTMEFRIERMWFRSGWIPFGKKIETWEAVNANGEFIDYDDWRDEDNDIVYYETYDEAKKVMDEFIKKSEQPDVPVVPEKIISRLSPWYVVEA